MLDTTTKTCIDCVATKPLDGFYRHPNAKHGRSNVCKDCQKARMKLRRLTNPAVQEYDRERHKNNPDRARRIRENTAKWNAANPLGYKAHYQVTNAVRDGRLKKTPCVICGSDKRVHGHHKDYSKPLDVRWLCRSCHVRHHQGERRAGGLLKRGPSKGVRRNPDKFDPLIMEVAARHDVPADTLRKWRSRGVPHRFRCWVIAEADRRGVPHPQFELRRAA
mgnify:CR=1 FL=1